MTSTQNRYSIVPSIKYIPAAVPRFNVPRSNLSMLSGAGAPRTLTQSQVMIGSRKSTIMMAAAGSQEIASTFKPDQDEHTLSYNKIVVFSVTYCPHCTEAKKTIIDSGFSGWLTEVDTLEN